MCPNFFLDVLEGGSSKRYVHRQGSPINRKYETFLTKFSNMGLYTAIYNIS